MYKRQEYELREEKEEKQALEEEQYAEEYPKKNDFSEMEYEEESQQDGYDAVSYTHLRKSGL